MRHAAPSACERQLDAKRLVDKDAHDVYRLLVATETADLAERLAALADDELAGKPSRTAMAYLRQLFGGDGDGLGAAMAGRAEELVGDLMGPNRSPATSNGRSTERRFERLSAVLGVGAQWITSP